MGRGEGGRKGEREGEREEGRKGGREGRREERYSGLTHKAVIYFVSGQAQLSFFIYLVYRSHTLYLVDFSSLLREGREGG